MLTVQNLRLLILYQKKDKDYQALDLYEWPFFNEYTIVHLLTNKYKILLKIM